jgi:hypothetical protein
MGENVAEHASLLSVNQDYQLLRLGGYVEGEGDILAAYIAKVLSMHYDTDPDLGDGGIILHLTALLDEAMADLIMVCEALETGDVTTQGAAPKQAALCWSF